MGNSLSGTHIGCGPTVADWDDHVCYLHEKPISMKIRSKPSENRKEYDIGTTR